MTYEETIDYIQLRHTSFQDVGADAYKPGLERTLELSAFFGSPHLNLRVVHIGGTNGKGSVSHTIAAILQRAGYKVGLFTSPHLLDFRERIRIDGKMIGENDVVNFIGKCIEGGAGSKCSFFELTTIMAFDYFKKNAVDVAVVEVGLGGLLDSTNIVRPVVSCITNISFDHTDLLGKTLEDIAIQKAGIIKCDTPVVVGETRQPVRDLFVRISEDRNAPIFFAEDEIDIKIVGSNDVGIEYYSSYIGEFRGELGGNYQKANTKTVLCLCDRLKSIGFDITDNSIKEGFKNVVSLTGLRGRWTKISDSPLTVCDIGHNPAAWEWLSKKIQDIKGRKHIILGFVGDKDIESISKLLPSGDDYIYYFTQPSVLRKLPAKTLAEVVSKYGITGDVYDSVFSACESLKKVVRKDDFVFVGGSNYLVSDFYKYLQHPASEWLSGQSQSERK